MATKEYAYILLPLQFRQEGSYWRGECIAVGAAISVQNAERDIVGVRKSLIDAVNRSLITLAATGFLQQFCEKRRGQAVADDDGPYPRELPIALGINDSFYQSMMFKLPYCVRLEDDEEVHADG